MIMATENRVEFIKECLKLEYKGNIEDSVQYCMNLEYNQVMSFNPIIGLIRAYYADKIYISKNLEGWWYHYLMYGFSLNHVMVPPDSFGLQYLIAVRTLRKMPSFEPLPERSFFENIGIVYNNNVVPTYNGFINRFVIPADTEFVHTYTLLYNIFKTVDSMLSFNENPDMNAIFSNYIPFEDASNYKLDDEKYDKEVRIYSSLPLSDFYRTSDHYRIRTPYDLIDHATAHMSPVNYPALTDGAS